MTRLVRYILFWASLIMAAEGSAYFMLLNTRPKCFTVEGPRKTILSVKYSAPDLVMLSEDDSEEVQKTKDEKAEAAGLDQRFNQRFKEKMLAMKEAGRTMVDISITINQRGDTARSVVHNWANNKLGPKPNRVRHELSKMEGMVDFTTEDRDAPVEICVQSMAATPKTPSRVSLIVAQSAKVSKEARERQTKEAEKHMSRIGEDLRSLEQKVDMILTNADYAKENEYEFHEQSIAMNRASQYWPIIHLTILVVTGFTQANHIIRFFKSRHIY